MFDHSRIDLFVYRICISCYIHNVAFTSLSNIAPFERLWIIGQLRIIILRNTRATIVLAGSQFTRCIPVSKSGAKIKNQAGFFLFDKFTLQVSLGDESGGV